MGTIPSIYKYNDLFILPERICYQTLYLIDLLGTFLFAYVYLLWDLKNMTILLLFLYISSSTVLNIRVYDPKFSKLMIFGLVIILIT